LTTDLPTYNEALVKRGEIFLDLSLLHTGGQELQEMNRARGEAATGTLRASSPFRASSEPSSGYPTSISRASPTLYPDGSQGSL